MNVEKEKCHKRNTTNIRSSLKISTIEGSWWAVMNGATEGYFGAFFEYLRYSSYEISILSTSPIFFGSLIQILSRKAYDLIQSRKILIIVLKSIQNSTIPFIFYIGLTSGHFWTMLLLICLFNTCALSIAPPLISWMGYLVPKKIRGKYFGLRTQYIKLFILISSLTAGVILNKFNENPLIGFGIIFLIGLLANVLSTFILTKKYEPPYYAINEGNYKIDLNRPYFLKLKNFIWYDCLSELSYSLSAPLMIVYWLRNLNFNYIELAALINVSQFFSFISLKYFGEKIDHLGTYLVIRWTSILIAIFPLCWVLLIYMPNHLHLVLSIFILSIESALINIRVLAMDNKLFEHMNGKNMIRITSKRIFYRGIFIFFGGIIGGLLTKVNFHNQNILISQLYTPVHLVFIISSLFRLFVWKKYLLGKADSI